MRYVVSKYLEANNVEEALQKAKKMKASSVHLDQDVWKNREYRLKDEKKSTIGFKQIDNSPK